MNQIIASANTSTSAMYANVSKAIEDMILQYFPKNFFHDIYTSTEVSYRTMKKYKKWNSKNEIVKKKKPFLTIIPQFPGQDDSLFLYNTQITTNWDDMIGINARSLTNVICDEDNHFHMAYRFNHNKLDYECRIVFSTLNQALDYRQILQNKITWQKVLYYRTSLESMIPRIILSQMGRLMNIDIENSQYIGSFLKRLNEYSQYPITYKMKNASGHDEFFLYYTHNLLVIFSDLDAVSVTKKNFTDDFAEVRFRISVQFNMPAIYYVIGTSAHAKDLQISVKDINTGLGDDTIIPIYTLQNVYSVYPPVLDGKNFYANLVYRMDNPEEGSDDLVDFSDILRDPTEEFDIFYILKRASILNENIDPYITIYIYQDRDKMEEGKDYLFDWMNFRIQMKTMDAYHTYRALIYINMGLINDRKNRYYEKTRKDKRVH